MFIDTHTHLYDTSHFPDIEEALDRARQAGVDRLVAVGAGMDSTRAAVALAEKYPGIVATAGVHPHEAKDFDESQWAEIRDLLANPKVRAVGEIGLDYHYDFSTPEAQQFAFQSQISLAAHFGKPVVIHMREADEDTYKVLEYAMSDRGPGEDGGAGRIGPVVMHCFLGDVDAARRWLDLGCLLGIGGAVTFKKMDALREAVRFAPLERLLLETDCPYMTPHPHRGKRNEPAWVPLVAQTVAEVKGLTVEQVAQATTENAIHVFGTWD